MTRPRSPRSTTTCSAFKWSAGAPRTRPPSAPPPSSAAARTHHDLAIVANPAYQHTAFKVRSLAHLRAVYQRVLGRGVPVKIAFNHGVSIAFYFEDPEGHLIEVYWPTGVAWPQPYGDPIDLALSEEAIQRKVRELAAE